MVGGRRAVPGRRPGRGGPCAGLSVPAARCTFKSRTVSSGTRRAPGAARVVLSRSGDPFAGAETGPETAVVLMPHGFPQDTGPLRRMRPSGWTSVSSRRRTFRAASDVGVRTGLKGAFGSSSHLHPGQQLGPRHRCRGLCTCHRTCHRLRRRISSDRDPPPSTAYGLSGVCPVGVGQIVGSATPCIAVAADSPDMFLNQSKGLSLLNENLFWAE